MATLYRMTCPFCDEQDTYSQSQSVLKHCVRLHNKILPSRSYSAGNVLKPYTPANLKRFPLAAIKLGCVSCYQAFDTKSAYKEHVEETHLVFEEEPENPSVELMVNEINISAHFREYRQHCLANCSDYTDTDMHFNELFAISSILLLQKRNAYKTISEFTMLPTTLKLLYQKLTDDMEFRKTMRATMTEKIKDILRSFSDNRMDCLDAQLQLLTHAKSVNGAERNVVRAVESLLPSMKDLDLEKVSESHLSTAYVHPLMQALFAVDDPKIVAHCSNNKISDSTLERPDYAVDVYEQYQFDHPSCFGEIKCQSTTDALCMQDFYRLALFAKLAIDEFKLPSMICFQSVGHKVTFFHMQHLDSMLCYLELCTIHLPFVTRDMKNITSYLDDLLSVASLHAMTALNTNRRDQSRHPTLPMGVPQSSKKTLTNKRKLSISSLASSFHR